MPEKFSINLRPAGMATGKALHFAQLRQPARGIFFVPPSIPAELPPCDPGIQAPKGGLLFTIRAMLVRGAPLIGATADYGL